LLISSLSFLTIIQHCIHSPPFYILQPFYKQAQATSQLPGGFHHITWPSQKIFAGRLLPARLAYYTSYVMLPADSTTSTAKPPAVLTAATATSFDNSQATSSFDRSHSQATISFNHNYSRQL
jgi:hypothetical protein